MDRLKGMDERMVDNVIKDGCDGKMKAPWIDG